MKNLIIKICLLSIFCASLCAAARAQTPCELLSANLKDPDPKGTNIRAQASSNSKILKVIKTNRNYFVLADIKGFSNGWFQIISVYEDGDDGRTLFSGRGWIHSSLFEMEVDGNDRSLHAEPDANSRILTSLESDEHVVKLIACHDKWIKVSVEGKTGWLSPEGQYIK